MQRRRFNTLAFGAAVLSSGLSACGGGSDGPSGPLELAVPGVTYYGGPSAQALSDGSFLIPWSTENQSSWQRYAADGKALGGVVNVPLSGWVAAMLHDDTVVMARMEAANPGEDTVRRVQRILGYAVDGAERFSATVESDPYTSLLAVLPSGDFLMVSKNAESSIYGEPPLPSPYAQTQVQRYNRSGVAVGTPLRFPGSRGYWLSVQARPQGGYWMLRTEIQSFGAKYMPAQGSHVVLERYDDNDRLQASTTVAVVGDVSAVGGKVSDFAMPSVQGLSVHTRPDGGAVVTWAYYLLHYGPAPDSRPFVRAFDASAQPLGAAQSLWNNFEERSNTSVILDPALRTDGSLDVFVVRHEGDTNQRWWLRTLDGRSGTWTGDARLVLERPSSASFLGAWKMPLRLRNGAAVVFLPVDETQERRFLMRKLDTNGNWQAWAA